jgi:hypothetical protein
MFKLENVEAVILLCRKVLKDMEGDGKMLYVNFPDMCLTMAVPKRMLRNAAVRRITAQSSPDFVEDTLVVSTGHDVYDLGASGSLEVPDPYEEGETNYMSGIARYADSTWVPWSNDEGSRAVAERLNQEGWMISMGADAVPFEDASWFKSGSKTAATIDQVRNEVKTMLREGYCQVDIKDAIKRRYPEHAGEALSTFDKNAVAQTMPVSIAVNYPPEMEQEEVMSRIKAMISNSGQLLDTEIGEGKFTSEPSQDQGGKSLFATATVELDVNFINGMSVGSYLEEDDGQVGYSLEAPSL